VYAIAPPISTVDLVFDLYPCAAEDRDDRTSGASTLRERLDLRLHQEAAAVTGTT